MPARTTFFAIVLSVFAAKAQSQDLTNVCLQLVGSGLIDTQDFSLFSETQQSEFDLVCTNTESRETRHRSSSANFKAVFKAFGGRGGGSSGRSLSKEEIDQRCEIGNDEFKSFLQTNYSQSTGRNLAQYVVNCTEVVARANIEAFTGYIRVSENDLGFSVSVRHSPGPNPLKYTLTGIPEGYQCFVNNPPAVSDSARTTTGSSVHQNSITTESPGGTNTAIGNVSLFGSSEDAFFCRKPAGEPAQGSFVFEANINNGDPTRRVIDYYADSREANREKAAAIEARVTAITERLGMRLDRLDSPEVGIIPRMENDVANLLGRNLQCSSYAADPSWIDRGRGGRYSQCRSNSEVLVGCILGSDQGSYTTDHSTLPHRCYDQKQNVDWIVAVCCEIR